MDPVAATAGLDEDQRRAVTSTAMPLAVVAPAGSGKTRVLTSRIAHRVATGTAEPSHVLCVTFTRKAATELAGRLSRLGLRERIEAGTFHAVARRQLWDRWAALGRTPPTVLDRVRPFLATHVAPRADPSELAELAAEIGWARSRLVTPEAYPDAAAAAGRRTRRPAEWVAERWVAYDSAKRGAGVVDFDDLLVAAIAAVEQEPAFAAAQRWRFRHLFVDEFQDVNPLQFRLLEAWRGDRADVFVVGDPHQSIYGWNGADPGLLHALPARWPALEVIELGRTHRSTPQITAGAAAVIRAAGLVDRHPESSGPPGPAPRVLAHEDGVDEVTAVAAAIRRRRAPDAPWAAFAVLARTHDQLVDVDRGLTALGIPTRVQQQSGLLGEPPVRRTLARLARDGRPLLAALPDAVGDRDRDDPAVELLEAAADVHASQEPGATGTSFAAWARTGLDIDAGPRRDAVTLSTIHAAKGLEWPVVHVVGVEEGSIPISTARRREARDEEARLLYVAVTRAVRELTLHWARRRHVRGVLRTRERSPFLEGFEDAVAARPEPPAVPGAVRIEALRPLVRPAEANDPVLIAVRAWRANRARAARTSPDLVLPDVAVEAIARLRPLTSAALAGVPGIGPARVTRFGDEVVAVVRRAAGPGTGAAS